MTPKSLRAILVWLAIAGFGGAFDIPPSARAASLQRLADGRVIITAFGERLAFRQKDAARIDFFWVVDPPCDPRDGVGATLADWLNDPKVAECLNRTIPDEAKKNPSVPMTSNITFRVILTVDDGLIYPGGIEPKEIPKALLHDRSLDVTLRHSYIKTDCTFPEPTIPDRLGYELHRINKNPQGDEYRLKASGRLGQASRPLCVACGGPPDISCSVHLISSDRTAEIGLGWEQGDLVGPQPDWLNFDAAARKIAQSIFIDRPAEDFQ